MEEKGKMKHTGKPLRLQDFQNGDVLSADILDVMAHTLRNITDVTWAVIESPCVVLSSIDGDPSMTAQKERPLIRIRMPVNFTHGTRMNRNQSSGEIFGNRENTRVNDLDSSSRCYDWLLLTPVEGVRIDIRENTGRTGDILLLNIFWCFGTREDEQLTSGDVIESIGGDLEILCENLFGVTGECLGDQEGTIFGEGAIIEDEKKLDSIRETLDGVGNSAGEKPDVTLGNVVDESLAFSIHRLDTSRPVQHQSPLTGGVP